MEENEVKLYTDCVYDETKIRKNIEESGVLDQLINPGETVLLKPNFVQEKDSRNEEWEQVITHPSVITAIIGVVCDKLQGSGKIIIADSPMCPTRFDKLLSHFPVDTWREVCKKNGIQFDIIDLRDEEWWIASNGAIIRKSELPSDPIGKVLFNLMNDNSEFFGKMAARGYYGADYDVKETNKAHDGINNWYSVSKTVMSADVFINIPKLKSHRKAGITCCLKNLVGINTNKNYLPHHSNGTPEEGGDQYESSSTSKKIEGKVALTVMRFVNKFKILMPILVPLKNLGIMLWGKSSTQVRGGGWYGNDTLWRSIIDLNKVLLYGSAEGDICDDSFKRKRYVAVVDSIIAGEGDGPLTPDRKECGYMLIGKNPVAVDCIASFLMGFDYRKIPSVLHSFDVKKLKLVDFKYDDIVCDLGDKQYKIEELPRELIKQFRPASGWIGHIES